MYQSKYYTCEEIDERLLKGYYDDAVSKGYPRTFDQFKLELASQDAVNLDILNNYTGYTSTEAISKINELYPTISHPLTFVFLDKTYNRERRFKYKGAGASSSRRNYIDNSNYIFTLDELNGAEGATDINGLLSEISSMGFFGSAIVIHGNQRSYYCGQLIIFGDDLSHVVNQILLTNNLLSEDGTTITTAHNHTRTFQYDRFLVVSRDGWVDREGKPVANLTNSKWYPSDYDLQKLQNQIDPIELNDYTSDNNQLPRTSGTFTIGGYLAHSRSINHNNEVYLIFCGQHSGATGNTGQKYILYKESTTSAGIYTFSVQYDQANVPDWVKRAFNEATATDTYTGLMSSDMFTKLLNTVPDACVTCSTAAATADKVITVNSFMSLPAQGGGSIKVKFTNANTAANPTLNISGTGAKPLYFGDEVASAENTWEAGSIVEVFYDGTKYIANSNNYKVLKDINTTLLNHTEKLSELSQKAGESKELLEGYTEKNITSSLTYENGYRISTTGVKESLSDARLYSPIKLKRNDKIDVSTSIWWGNYYSVIAKYDEEAGTYEPLVKATFNDNNVHQFSYSAESDITIVVSSRGVATIKLTSQGKFQDVDDDFADVNAEIEKLKQKDDDIDNELIKIKELGTFVYKDFVSNLFRHGLNLTKVTVGQIFDPRLYYSDSYNTYWHNQIDVESGEVYYIEGTLNYTYSGSIQGYIFLDENNIVLSVGTSTDDNITLTVPDNAKYLILQSTDTEAPRIFKKIEGITDIATCVEKAKEEWDKIPCSVYTDQAQAFVMKNVGETFTYEGSGWGHSNYIANIDGGDELIVMYQGGDAIDINILDSRNKVLMALRKASFKGAVRFKVPENADILVMQDFDNARSSTGLWRKKKDISIVDCEKEKLLVAMNEKANVTASDNIPVKRLTLGWITDTHNDSYRYRRFIKYVDSHNSIQGVLHTGDMNIMADTDSGFVSTVLKYKPNVPLMAVIGNHEALGQENGGKYPMTSGSHKWMRDKYIAPFNEDSVVMSENGCYYYRDFTSQKIRIVVLNDYDAPRYIEGGGWITTTDTSTATEWVSGKSYAVGDVVIYKGLYLQCTTAGNLNDDGVTYRASRVPLSKYNIFARYFQQAQIDFIVNALNVESGWSVVFASHQTSEPFTSALEIASEKFTAHNNLQTGVLSHKFAQNGFILTDIISAYINRTTLNKVYSACAPNTNANGALLNNQAIMPDVTVNVDFTNAKGDVICCLSGHSHSDGCYYSAKVGDKKLLMINCTTGCYRPDGKSTRFFSGDIIKGGEAGKDSFNIISFDTTDKKVYLLRVGADVNDDFQKRDYDVVSYAH